MKEPPYRVDVASVFEPSVSTALRIEHLLYNIEHLIVFKLYITRKVRGSLTMFTVNYKLAAIYKSRSASVVAEKMKFSS